MLASIPRTQACRGASGLLSERRNVTTTCQSPSAQGGAARDGEAQKNALYRRPFSRRGLSRPARGDAVYKFSPVRSLGHPHDRRPRQALSLAFFLGRAPRRRPEEGRLSSRRGVKGHPLQWFAVFERELRRRDSSNPDTYQRILEIDRTTSRRVSLLDVLYRRRELELPARILTHEADLTRISVERRAISTNRRSLLKAPRRGRAAVRAYRLNPEFCRHPPTLLLALEGIKTK